MGLFRQCWPSWLAAANLPGQYHRNPCRCQPMTVSGLTMIRAERHPDHKRNSQTQNHRSAQCSLLRPS
jgi:hypothetical protein